MKKLEIKTKEDVTTQLIELERALTDPTVYFKKDYRYYLLTAWVDILFSLIAHYRDILLAPVNYYIFKKLNDLAVFILENVEVNHTKGLNIGQMTYNALGASEYNYVNTYLQLRYATDVFDHDYLKTGTGIGEPDFRVAEDWELSYFSPESRQLETITLKAGTLIDAKDYPDREKADAQLKTNVDGHLGHFKAKYLLVHVFFPESWYLTENRAEAPQYKLEGFKPIPFRRQVSLSKDAEGLLKVDYFPTYAYKY